MDDQPRSAATSPDKEYSLSIDDAALIYERAGLPRTLRTIQRYCAKGHLDCRRVEIPYGEKFLITPASVVKHIAYIEETRQTMAGRDEPRPVATNHHQQEASGSEEQRPAPAGRDESRQTAAMEEAMSRYVGALERENDFLRGQVTVKDKQIGELTERARETNVLIAGLQKMLTPLLGRGGEQHSDTRASSHGFDRPAPTEHREMSAGDNSEAHP